MRGSVLIIVVGLCVGLTGTVLWLAGSGGPAKFPADLDLTEVSTGTLTFFVNPALPGPTAPREFPLTVRRRLHAVQSSGSTVVLGEEETQTAGPVLNWSLHHVYVVDRSSLKSVADDRAYAYTQENSVDRSPYYAVGVPRGSDGRSYRVWQNETGTTCAYSSDNANVHSHGAVLRSLTCHLAAAPAQPYYVVQLATLGLPTQVGLGQITPQLVAAGIDLQQLATRVLPHLSASDRTAIRLILVRPINLRYLVDIDSQFLVEPGTGGILDGSISKTLSAQLDLRGVSEAEAIFTRPRYAADPEIAAALATLRRLIPRPPTLTVFTASYAQTPQSVRDAVDRLADRYSGAGLARSLLPPGLLITGLAVAVVGAVANLVSRRRQEQGGS